MNTINDAIKIILKASPEGLTVKEIYKEINENNLYMFNSLKPEHIIMTQIRRRCEGLDFKSSFKEKFYRIIPGGRYTLIVTG